MAGLLAADRQVNAQPEQNSDDQLITFIFVGEITRVEDRLGLLGGTLAPGARFTGLYVFDAATPEDPSSKPTETVYPGALTDFRLLIGPHMLRGSGPANEIRIENSPKSDVYFVQHRAPRLLDRIAHATLFLRDLEGDALPDDSLPRVPPDLSLFEVAEFTLADGGPIPAFVVGGEIQALAAGPGPECDIPLECINPCGEPCGEQCKPGQRGSSGAPCPSDACYDRCCAYDPVDEVCDCAETPICQVDDGNPCTDDGCNSATGCYHDPVVCVQNACRNDYCDPLAGGCVFVGVNCNDNDACTIDSCDPESGCEHQPRDCQGSDPCLLYDCDPDTDCTSEPKCPDDGQCCNGNEFCNAGTCDTTGNPCAPDEVCEESPRGEDCFCRDCINDAECADGNPCTQDSCVAGSCTHANLPNGTLCPDDGYDCTDDICVAGVCTHPPIPNGSECDADDNPCTYDVCAGNACVWDHDEPPCSDCDGGRCDDSGVCLPLTCGLEFFDKPLVACPEQLVQTYIKVTCLPDCPDVGPVSLTYEFPYPEAVDAWGSPTSAACPHDPDTYTLVEVSLFLGSGVEPRTAPYDVIIHGTLEDATCGLPLSVTVRGPDLDLPPLPEEMESTPGAYLRVNSDDDGDGAEGDCFPDLEQTEGLQRPVTGEDDIKTLTIGTEGLDPAGMLRLGSPLGGFRIKIYKDQSGSLVLFDQLGQFIPVAGFPTTLFLEPILPSANQGDTRLRLTYNDPTGWSCFDYIWMTLIEVDLDVDSNNDGTIDPNNTSGGTDDKIEDKPLYPVPSCAPNFVGKWVWPNNDDSDDPPNGVPDNLSGSVDELFIDHASELGPSWDVVPLEVQAVKPASLGAAGFELFLEVLDPDRVRVFSAFQPNALALLGPGFPTAAPVNFAMGGWTFGLEGVAPGTTMISVILKKDGQEIAYDEVRVTVVGLEVKWETPGNVEVTEPNWYYSSDVPTNPPPGPFELGVRYFPDAVTLGSGWSDVIQVRVRTIPPAPGFTAHLKALDPDDPSASAQGNEVDADMVGPDNRAGAGILGITQGTTIADGSFWSDFTVGRKAGDNHRVAATLKPGALDSLNDQNVPPSTAANPPPQPQTQDQIATFPGNISPLLTVWRRLWVERDTMRAPLIQEYTVTGFVGPITPNSPAPGQSTIDLGQNLPDDFSDLNLYEQGQIVFSLCPAGTDTFTVISSTSVTNPLAHDSIVVVGVPGACATGSFYTLNDDDDPTALPHLPDGGQFLVDAFAQAYILPIYAPAQYETTLGFELHINDWEGEYGYGPWDDGRQLHSFAAEHTWVCLVVGCWESGQNDDADPDNCPAPPIQGAETGTTGKTDDDSGASMIFMQALSDDVGCTFATNEAHTLTHEIAHTCEQHPQHIPNSIMDDGAPRNMTRFDDESLRIFREQDEWSTP